jgi:hypothetical protein
MERDWEWSGVHVGLCLSFPWNEFTQILSLDVHVYCTLLSCLDFKSFLLLHFLILIVSS